MLLTVVLWLIYRHNISYLGNSTDMKVTLKKTLTIITNIKLQFAKISSIMKKMWFFEVQWLLYNKKWKFFSRIQTFPQIKTLYDKWYWYKERFCSNDFDFWGVLKFCLYTKRLPLCELATLISQTSWVSELSSGKT